MSLPTGPAPPQEPTGPPSCNLCCLIYTKRAQLDPKGTNSIQYFRAAILLVTGITLIVATILVGRQQTRRPKVNSFQRKLLLVTIGVVVLHMIGGILPITMGSIVIAYGYTIKVPWYLYVLAACIAGATWTIAWFICYIFYIIPHRTSWKQLLGPSIAVFFLITTSHLLGTLLGSESGVWWGYVASESLLLPFFFWCFINSFRPLFCFYPRPVLRYWSGYLLVMHTLFITCYIMIALEVPHQYCVAIASEIFFAVSFALVIYFVLYKDGQYLAEETAPLLAQYKDGTLSMIPWEELQVESNMKGAGSHGAVYKAYWGSEAVAVKKITFANARLRLSSSGELRRFNTASLAPTTEDEESLVALAREASYLVELRHPSIVQFYGITKLPEGTDMFGIVTKYMEHNLYEVIQDQVKSSATPIAWPTRLKWVRDLAFGLKYLHSKGINHGDLKSMNILLSTDLQTCQICDFGSAGRIATATMHTPQWTSPEVLKGLPYSSKADVYSFGVLVWEITTFNHPYSRMAQRDATDAIVNGKQLLSLCPSVIPVDTPLLLTKIMGACFHKFPKKRPSMKAICSLLSVGNQVEDNWGILSAGMDDDPSDEEPAVLLEM